MSGEAAGGEQPLASPVVEEWPTTRRLSFRSPKLEKVNRRYIYKMTTKQKGIPEGASVIIPRLYCHDVEGEIEFCCEALGAVEGVRRPGPNGRAQHAMLLFGPAMLMIEAENPEVPTRPPNPDGSSPVVIFLYVEDVDATVERAVKRGAKLVVPVETHFWGDRIGWVQDLSGHMWTIASRVEETTENQRRERWSKILSEQSGGAQS